MTALVAATAALAQQSTSQAPPARSAPQQQSPSATSPPSDSSPGMSSQSSPADKQALMKDCLTQVKAANPGVADKDIKAFCDREVNQSSPQN